MVYVFVRVMLINLGPNALHDHMAVNRAALLVAMTDSVIWFLIQSL